MKDDVETPEKINPHQNTSSSAKMRRYFQKCVLQSLARKVLKRKKEPSFEHYISPLCPAGPTGLICTIFGMLGRTAVVIIQVKF